MNKHIIYIYFEYTLLSFFEYFKICYLKKNVSFCLFFLGFHFLKDFVTHVKKGIFVT